MIISRSRTMHPQSPPLTVGGTLLKELCWIPCYIGSDIWFQDDLREASSLGFQSSFSKTWYVEEVLAGVLCLSLLGRCFRGLVLPVLEYCSAVWCSAADTHLKLLNPAVSGARFLTRGVFECDIAHRRSMAELCMLYKIRCDLMLPLNGALPSPFEPVRVARGDLVTSTSVYLCSASLQNLAAPQDFYSPLRVPLKRSTWPRIRWCWTGGFQE